jgi:hypothetical protein
MGDRKDRAMTPRRWVAWRLSQLAHRIDPSAYWTQEIEVVYKTSTHPSTSTLTHFISIEANAFHGGIDSISHTSQLKSLPYAVNVSMGPEYPWETL